MPSRYTVKGSVTLDGQPIENGQIIFLPADGGGRPDGTEIQNGEYEVVVTEGAKRVEITATQEIPAAEPGGIPDYKPLVPKKYNENSELTASINSNDENTADFALSSK